VSPKLDCTFFPMIPICKWPFVMLRFVNDIVNGRVQRVLRFERGTGFALPGFSDLILSASSTAYTISMVMKLDRTSCNVRLVNMNPGEDGGLYLCDGIQVSHFINLGINTQKTGEAIVDYRALISVASRGIGWSGC
jgi:hypothetical protein